MNLATTTLRCFARSIIRHEAQVNPPPAELGSTALAVTEKLRPVLATYMGRAGYHALISRALVLASEEAPCLQDVGITSDGSLENFAELSAKHESAEVSNGSEVLIAQLIGLLVAFIGEALTLRIVHELWPDLPADDNFFQGNSNE